MNSEKAGRIARLLPPFFFIALCAWVLSAAGKMPAGTEGTPGPAFFPRVTALAMGLLGIVLLLNAALAGIPAAGNGAAEKSSSLSSFLFFLLVLVYACAIQPLGFPLATVLFLLAAIQGIRMRGFFGNLIISAAGTIGVYLIFGALLKVSLPALPFGL